MITLAGGYLLSLGGYLNIWPLFGSANQLLAAMVLVSLSVFLKVTGRKGYMLYVPMVMMLVVTMTSLGMSVYEQLLKVIRHWRIRIYDRRTTIILCCSINGIRIDDLSLVTGKKLVQPVEKAKLQRKQEQNA